MNYRRMYEYRFRDVEQASRIAVWREIAHYIADRLGRPERVLDPAAGRCEFINSVPARERWAIDSSPELNTFCASDVKCEVADVFAASLPDDYFDGILVSNFLEHLPSVEEVARFLELMKRALRSGGRLAVLGPNFKYCAREYFDCADHRLILTDVAVEELLYAVDLDIECAHARFLPYSFRGRLPASALLTRLYLRLPWMWTLFGKQFFIVARKHA